MIHEIIWKFLMEFLKLQVEIFTKLLLFALLDNNNK